MHLMALGMYLFEMGTLPFEDMQRKTDWQHARSARVGARDATQFTGPGNETISLSGAVYTELTDGRVSLDDLRAMADEGNAWPLVGGAGDVYGSFVITAIDERHAYLMSDGTPRRIDFGVDLLRVDDDAAANNTATSA
ncbi:phage P2 GpU family protein [Novosphingobium sp. Rr 2-17]|uniref:phage tail protein n=1 Tax=Novosphingobium sp. Rr 2-17 TaxID=555793 RepID=UPI00026988EA|nr:phage tail protein [Novosphingobium sp. Rr 2-17]EIZ77783.1 phage P2 GpU family protein [Novosphingobium sp. Rr 2-17]